MYKLMIAEDEALARDAILEMIDFARFGFEVVAVCENGQEAAEAYFAHNPDLVITDICMPLLSGLQLAGLIYESGRGTPVIIITGYDDFNFARQAIRSQVASYILKPVTPDEFMEVLREAQKKLDERRHQALAVEKTERQLHRISPLVRDQILSRLVQGAFVLDELREIGPDIGLNFDEGFYQTGLVQPKHLHADARHLGVNTQLLQYMVFNISQELAAGVHEFIAFQLPDGRACLIGAMAEPESLELCFRNLAQRIRTTIHKAIQIDVAVSGGKPVSSLGEIQLSFQSAQHALEQLYRLPGQSIIFASNLEAMKSPINLSHYEDQIILKVRLQGKNDVNDAITELARAIQMSALSLDNIQYEWNRLANRLLDLLLASGDCELAMPDLSWCQMDETDVLDEFSKSLRTFCFQCIDRLGGKRNQENQRLALLAQTYIQAHYADSHLSLMEVARHANVSLSHFCQIFKEETGKTFVEYLTEIRMERAKEMLRSTDRMLYDIAECVGYENPAYFTVAFKKQVGLSPRDYRKQFGKGS